MVNSFRYLTGTPDEAVELLRDIELVSRLKATGIVNSSNLGAETTAEDVLGSVEYAERAAETAGLPLVFTVAERRLGLTQFRGVEVYVRPFWE